MIFPFISNESIDAEASRLRIEALPPRSITELPVDLDAIVFDYLCERDELVVDFETELEDEGGEEVLGKTRFLPGRIQVNSRLRQDSGRFRFTLAHEIGHWVLHRATILAAGDQIGLFGGPSAKLSLTTLNRSLTDPRPPREEIQANRFAASLLIDHTILRREIARRFGENGVEETLRQIGALERPHREQARIIAQAGPNPHLAAQFAVSLEAMAIAIEGRMHFQWARPSSTVDSAARIVYCLGDTKR